MDDIKVSIIIPVKDGEKFLCETLEALLKQATSVPYEKIQMLNFSICIYDDGSTDDSPDVVDRLRAKFEEKRIPVKYERGEHSRGVGFAKNRACRMARGEFLCFNDADDISNVLRIQKQYELAKEITNSSGKMVFIGCNVIREPINSTERYIRWANQLVDEELKIDIYSSHGPTILAPTWFISKGLFDVLGGFNEAHKAGYPEDLDFFYRSLDLGNVEFRKVPEVLVTYRYHPSCASFGVDEQSIWELRLERLQKDYIAKWEMFTIWSAGKQGKRFFRCLTDLEKRKVSKFCDVDAGKLAIGCMQQYAATKSRTMEWRVPLVHVRAAKPPLVICVKRDLTNGDLERFIEEKNIKHGVDYVHFG